MSASNVYQSGKRIKQSSVIPLVLALTFIAFGCSGTSDTTTSTAILPATKAIETQTNLSKTGDTVTVHYHGTLEEGGVFDSSRDGDPITFVIGSGQVIPGFDEAVLGLAIGESTKVRLTPEKAYGEHRSDLILEMPRTSESPQDLSPGDLVQLTNGMPAIVLETTSTTILIDANHPLAGQILTFEIELVAIG